MELLRKTGRFYKEIIINNIGIFIFIGILSVIFHDYGWFPNENMYAISQLVYHVALPVLISFEGGRKTGGNSGGLTAALAVCGIAAGGTESGLWGALLIGPAAGFLWKYSFQWISGKCKASLQMLVKNLWIAVLAGIMAGMAYAVLTPVMNQFITLLSRFTDMLVKFGMLGTLAFIIEPAKVFFLNNLMNHSILVPLGMSQAVAHGSSVFFLLEANPGPGFGMLGALFLCHKEKRQEYGAAMFTQAVGGLHEVYFPYVLSNLWLLLPLMAGGFAGNLTFQYLHAGLQGPVSPGSVVTILLMAGKNTWLFVLAGLAVSTAVSFAGSLLVLKMTAKSNNTVSKEISTHDKSPMNNINEEKNMKIQRIAVVCDGGVGTSAMGASILRRRLAQEKLTGIQVDAYAADLIPDGIDLIVCQKDLYDHLPEELRSVIGPSGEIYTAGSLLTAASYDGLVRLLQERGR